MTTLEIHEGITTDELCPDCGAAFVLISDDSPESIRVICGCGSVTVLS